MTKIAIIIGSTRPGRNGEAVARWVHDIATKRQDADFEASGAVIRGVSTQRPDQLSAFVTHTRLPYPLLSDQDSKLAAGLLPTFRAAGVDRSKRLTLLADPNAIIRAVQFPISDPADSVEDMLTLVRARQQRPRSAHANQSEISSAEIGA